MAEKFANVCAPASCEAEFNYECDKLKQYILDQGSGAQYEKKAAYIDVLREKKQGYFDYTPVMMNGQLATGAPVIAYICAYGHLLTCCLLQVLWNVYGFFLKEKRKCDGRC